MIFHALLASLLLIGTVSATTEDFSYSAQDEWGGICVTGNNNEQSPIDIDESSVEFDDDLEDLAMSGWGVEYEGTFSNTGHNLQFDPTTTGQATTENHLGSYGVLQFHMHWGTQDGEGSEHLISGNANEVEIHFVHSKVGETDTTARDYLSVIAIMATVDEDASISGPWAQLNASAVPVYQDSINISGFSFNQLLPENLDYYFYYGSLTTPTCDETVAWFVLKETITVPAAYLEQLRAVQGTDGSVLGFNFREPQDIGSREVKTNSQANVKPLVSLLMLSLVLIGLFLC